ncbi:MAG TPA: hypothetical protein VN688_07350 [Gemmataceae bacterium]|nr:hypothetical protein [Gemmataceae bacterium]
MRRGLLLFLSVGLLSTLAGCGHRTQGICDCQVYPLDHGTPSPLIKPGAGVQPIHPVPEVAPLPAP